MAEILGDQVSSNFQLVIGNQNASVALAAFTGIQNGSIPLSITVTDDQKTPATVRVKIEYKESTASTWTLWSGVESGVDYVSFSSYTDKSQTKEVSFPSISKLGNGFKGEVDFKASIIYDDSGTVTGATDTKTCTINNCIELEAQGVKQYSADGNLTDETVYLHGRISFFNRATGETYKLAVTEVNVNDSALSGFPINSVDNASLFQIYKNSSWQSWDESQLASGMDFRVRLSVNTGVSASCEIDYTIAAYEVTGTSVPTATAHYKMNETSGSTCTDSSGSADGTVYGPTINQTGKINKCYSFDGVNDYVDIPARNDSAGTICAWVYVDTNTLTGSRVIYSGRGSNARDQAAFFVYDSKLRFYVTTGTTTGTMHGYIESTASLSTGWHHVVITSTGSEYKFYIDGTLAAINALFASHNNSGAWLDECSPTEAFIGTIRGSSGDLSAFYLGKIDDLRIYNSALTASQIAAIYNSGSGTED